MGTKVRPNLGDTARQGDAGRSVAAEALLTVIDPLHTFNKEGLVDLSRYDLKNPQVQALLATIRESGPPRPPIVRLNGNLPKKHPINEAVTILTGAEGPQPALEVIEGNTTVWLVQMVNEERRKQGVAGWRVMVDFRPNLSDAAARSIYLRANRDRQANTFWLELSYYRERMREPDISPDILQEKDRFTLTQLKEFAVFDSTEDCVARAYSEGKITLLRAREIAKLPRAQHEAALTDRKLGKREHHGTLGHKAMARFSVEVRKTLDPSVRLTVNHLAAVVDHLTGTAKITREVAQGDTILLALYEAIERTRRAPPRAASDSGESVPPAQAAPVSPFNDEVDAFIRGSQPKSKKSTKFNAWRGTPKTRAKGPS